MHLLAWPHWLDWLSWLWRNPNSYNLWSSEWGGLVFKVPLLIWAARKLNCHVTGCPRYGHPVPSTGHRACKRHHPVLSHGRVTEQHIHEAHKEANER